MPEGAGPIVLDTHVWIWMVEGEMGRLCGSAIEEVERASQDGEVLISAISVWEVAMLEAKDRIRMSRPLDEWVGAALNAPGVHHLGLEPRIAVESTRLPGVIHGDPADRILIASARVVGARFATCDRGIIDYGACGHVGVLDARP